MNTTHEVDKTRPEPLRGNRFAPDGGRFPWGVIEHVYEIGPYAIVKYRADKSTFADSKAWEEHGKLRYHPYIREVDTHRSYETLDAALVGVVAVCNEGPNTQADAYFMRMIGKGED